MNGPVYFGVVDAVAGVDRVAIDCFAPCFLRNSARFGQSSAHAFIALLLDQLVCAGIAICSQIHRQIAAHNTIRKTPNWGSDAAESSKLPFFRQSVLFAAT